MPKQSRKKRPKQQVVTPYSEKKRITEKKGVSQDDADGESLIYFRCKLNDVV